MLSINSHYQRFLGSSQCHQRRECSINLPPVLGQTGLGNSVDPDMMQQNAAFD